MIDLALDSPGDIPRGFRGDEAIDGGRLLNAFAKRQSAIGILEAQRLYDIAARGVACGHAD